MIDPGLRDRLLAMTAKSDGCWEWKGYKNPKGYGVLDFRGRPLRAHRVSYEIHVGPIPDGLTIDHLCRNKGCVNPAHLEVVTRAENTLRGAREKHPWLKLGLCKNGHPRSGDNLYIHGKRRKHIACRQCCSEYDRARHKRARDWARVLANAVLELNGTLIETPESDAAWERLLALARAYDSSHGLNTPEGR